MKPHLLSLCLGLSLLTACNATVDRHRARAEFASSSPFFSSRTVQEIESRRRQVALPGRVVVAPPVWRDSGNWTAPERELLEDWGRELRQQGLASDFELMSTAALGGKPRLDPPGSES